MKEKKHFIPLAVLGFIWAGLALWSYLKPEDAFSASERRKLAGKPKLQTEAVLSGSYFNEFEKYTLDQFPLRDNFRTLKSVAEFYLFGKKDNNDIYISDGYAAKMEYPLNEKSVTNAMKKLNDLYEMYLQETDGKICFSVVPDKGYFLAGQTGHLAMDYEKLFDIARQKTPWAEYVDLTQALELEDYYRTDSHWKQEKITDAAGALAEALGISLSGVYGENVVEKPFYGVYYGQSALPLKSDEIRYLSNEILDACSVYNEETQETTGIYNLNKLESRDMYEVYLSGASPLLVVENPKAETEKELVVFRDSFGSSMVPLLAEGYAKITLVDIRYMPSQQVGEYVDFGHADVLFLYSATILNNSQSLR